MMHGREKSDPAIVATKPPNEARTGAEEAGEPRAGAKGKADQQSTRRALNRESVSQALDRLRQAARQRKKERFTALLHHINLDLLRMAGSPFGVLGSGDAVWLRMSGFGRAA